MAIRKGLLVLLALLAAGGVFLFIWGTVAVEVVDAHIFFRIWLIVAVFSGAAVCGFYSRQLLKNALLWWIILVIIVLGCFVWFIPQLLSFLLLLKLVLGGLVWALVGNFFGYNLAKAKKAMDDENNIQK